MLTIFHELREIFKPDIFSAHLPLLHTRSDRARGVDSVGFPRKFSPATWRINEFPVKLAITSTSKRQSYGQTGGQTE